jgi:hypothetical protein
MIKAKTNTRLTVSNQEFLLIRNIKIVHDQIVPIPVKIYQLLYMTDFFSIYLVY